MRHVFRKKAMWVAILLILVVLLTSAALSIFSKGTSLPYRIANTIVAPFQKGFTAVKNGIASFWDAQTQYEALQKENEALRDEIRELKQLINDASRYQEENEQLRELLNIREQHVNLSIDTASVIAWNDTAWSSTFTIDRGTRDGVQVGCAVMTQDGLAGVVIQTDASTAEVRTIVDSNFSAGAQIADSGLLASANGSFRLMKNGRLRLEMLPLNSAVKVGDQIVTSGIGSLFPPELIIGEVVSVGTEADGMSLYAEVAPAARLDELKQVFVVLSFE